MLEGEVVAEDADRTGRAGLCGDECGFIGKEAVALTTKDFEALLQTMGNERRHPEMERAADKSGSVAAVGEIVAQVTIDKVGHALSRSCLLSVALLPAVFFQPLLKVHHAERVHSLRRISVAVVCRCGVATLYPGDVLGMNLHDHAAV